MISLAPYSGKSDPFKFSLNLSTLDDLNTLSKIQKSIRVEGCDIAQLASPSEFPLYLKSAKSIIDPHIESFEFELNPVIAINYILNKTQLIQHCHSRCTSPTTYNSFKSITDYSILPNTILFNSYSSIKLQGIQSTKNKSKNTKYLPIHLEIYLDHSIFHPINNSIHVNHPDISKYQLSSAYSKSMFLQQIKEYPCYKPNPVKRTAPVDAVVKVHNSLPISIPFYLKYYTNAMDNDLELLYKDHIQELYNKSNTVFNHLVQSITCHVNKLEIPLFNDHSVSDDINTMLSHLSKSSTSLSSLPVSPSILSSFNSPLACLLSSIINFNENNLIPMNCHHFLSNLLHFINKHIPFQSSIISTPLSTLSFQLINQIIPNISIPINLKMDMTMNIPSLYDSTPSELFIDYKLPIILFNFNHQLPFTNNFNLSIFVNLIAQHHHLQSYVNHITMNHDILCTVLYLCAIPMDSLAINPNLNIPNVSVVSKLMQSFPIKQHHILRLLSLFPSQYVQYYYKLFVQYDLKCHVVRIQNWYRKYRKHDYDIDMVVGMQCRIRGHLAVQQHNDQMWWIVNLQSLVRKYVIKAQFKNTTSSIVYIQSILRGKSVKMSFIDTIKSITATQSVIRKILIKSHYRDAMDSILLMQSLVRGSIVRSAYNNQLKWIINLQSEIRRTLINKDYHKIKNSIVGIQSCIKSKIVRHSFLYIMQSVTVVQSAIRSKLQQNHFHKIRNDLVLVQCRIRGYSVRCEYQSTISTIIAIQSRIRGRILQNIDSEKRECVVIVQALVRAYMVQQRIKCINKSVLSVQSATRCKLKRMRWLQIRQSVVILQSIIRGRLINTVYKDTIYAVIGIQCCIRTTILEQRHLQVRNNLICIQSLCRAVIARSHYNMIRQSIVGMQSAIRSLLARNHINNQLKWILTLQSLTRGSIIRNQLKSLIVTSTLYNTVYRAYMNRISFIILRQSVIINQKMIRGYLVRNRVQMEEYARYQERIKQNNASIKIQSVMRGYLIRKSNFTKIRHKLDTLGNSIGARCQVALSHVMHKKTIVELLEACKEIQRTTLLSRDLCQHMVQHDALGILLRAIGHTNRSEPHKLFIIEILLICRNISKHLELLGYFEEAWIEGLIGLIRKYYKEERILGNTMQLVYVLGLNSVQYERIQGYKQDLDGLLGKLQKVVKKKSSPVVLYMSKISTSKKYTLIGQDDCVMMRRGSRVGLSKRDLQAWFTDACTFGQCMTLLKSLLGEGKTDGVIRTPMKTRTK